MLKQNFQISNNKSCSLLWSWISEWISVGFQKDFLKNNRVNFCIIFHVALISRNRFTKSIQGKAAHSYDGFQRSKRSLWKMGFTPKSNQLVRSTGGISLPNFNFLDRKLLKLSCFQGWTQTLDIGTSGYREKRQVKTICRYSFSKSAT